MEIGYWVIAVCWNKDFKNYFNELCVFYTALQYFPVLQHNAPILYFFLAQIICTFHKHNALFDQLSISKHTDIDEK